MTIINLKKKYIFLANPKTGSTSVHTLLNDKESIIRCTSKKEKPFGKHDTYLQVKNYLSSINLNINDFFIFGFIREPIDRMKSVINHLLMSKNKKTAKTLMKNDWKQFMTYAEEKLFYSVEKMFFDENNQLPHNVHILKMENMEQELQKIFKVIKNSRKRQRMIKKERRTCHKNKGQYIFKKQLSDEVINLIKDRFPRDWIYYYS